MNRITVSRGLVWAGIILVLATGLIHLIEGPENYEEAAYKGILFFLNAAGAIVAAIGIYRGEKLWGWSLGLLVTGGALLFYIASRTIGLPGLEAEDEWFEPMGLASMVVEALFVLVYGYVMTQRPAVADRGVDAAMGQQRRA